MAMTVDELAVVVDSSLAFCLENEATGELALRIIGAELRVGAGPELADVVGSGLTPDACRDDYATKVSGRVMVIGGNPRGMEVHVPDTIIGGTGP